MNLHDILYKNYSAPLDAPVTRRHYIDRFPTGLGEASKAPRPSELSQHPKAQRFLKIVTKYLREHPGATIAEIAGHCKTTTDRIGSYTQRMCDAGVLRHEPGPVPKNGGRRKFIYFIAEGV